MLQPTEDHINDINRRISPESVMVNMNNANNANYADENNHFSVQQPKLSVTNDKIDEIDQSNHLIKAIESVLINTDDESYNEIPSFEQYGENPQNRL